MVRDYVTHLYAPSAESSRALATERGGPDALAEWKRKVRDAWGDVVVDHVQSLDGDQVEVGTPIHVSALVRLGALEPDDVEVQLVTGRVGSDDQLREPRITAFPAGSDVDGGLRRYEGTVEARRAGAIGYTVRVVPHHPLLVSTAEMGLAAVPSGMPSPPSA
jgi:starch phosphorylase